MATERLKPLGVEVVGTEGLPFADGKFSLVLNQHGRFDAAGLGRVLALGGRLLTKQVGSEDCVELNHALGVSVARHDAALRRLHKRIDVDGPFAVRTHRFLVRAAKPA